MNLRPYQVAAAAAVLEEWKHCDSTLVVMPTGSGKTILFAEIIRQIFPKRVLVLAHREELIFQARDKIQQVTGLQADVEMGEYRAESGLFGPSRVIVASIQTLCSGGDGGGRMSKFDPEQFGAVIIDEAHHATAPSYQRVITYYRTNPNLKILGVTASPDRTDEEALGQIFQSVAFDYEILDAINDGWLVPIKQLMVHVDGLDYSSIRTTAGDLNGGDLAAVLEAEMILQQMASASLEIIGQRRALVFTASVKTAEMTAEIFNRHRPGMAAWVCGKTDKDERRKILADFAAGKIQVVCNCGVLTEGFDDPGVEVIIMGRPTKSRSLYSQMVGRSTRPVSGVVDGPATAEERRTAIAASAKPSCLVVDFVGNSGRHKLMTTADILGGNVSDEAIELAVSKAKKSGRPINMTEAMAEAEQELKEQRELARLTAAARRARLVAKARFTTEEVDPFDVLAIQPIRARGWDSEKQLSEKCRSILQKHYGLDPDSLSYAQGMQLVREQIRRWDNSLCSFKQAKLLKRYGYATDVTFKEASAIIDALQKNGWKRPAEEALAA